MLLNELFKQPVGWKYTTNAPNIVEARFYIGGLGFTFVARTVDTDKMWEVEFTIGLPDSFGKSGTGHQQQVFATVFDIMKDFIKQHSPEIIVMTAQEPNRMKLYLRMFKTLLPDWKIETDREIIYAYNPNQNI
jgi:hypothetical protein